MDATMAVTAAAVVASVVVVAAWACEEEVVGPGETTASACTTVTASATLMSAGVGLAVSLAEEGGVTVTAGRGSANHADKADTHESASDCEAALSNRVCSSLNVTRNSVADLDTTLATWALGTTACHLSAPSSL